MSRAKRLQPVLQMAQAKVDEAEQALGYLNSRINEEEATKKQLETYEGEYLELMRGGYEPNRVMKVQDVMRYQSFIQRLEQAQIQQQEEITLLESQKEQVSQHWIKTRARAQAIEAAIEVAKQEENLKASREEQKQLDEFTSLALLRNKSFQS